MNYMMHVFWLKQQIAHKCTVIVILYYLFAHVKLCFFHIPIRTIR